MASTNCSEYTQWSLHAFAPPFMELSCSLLFFVVRISLRLSHRCMFCNTGAVRLRVSGVLDFCRSKRRAHKYKGFTKENNANKAERVSEHVFKRDVWLSRCELNVGSVCIDSFATSLTSSSVPHVSVKSKILQAIIMVSLSYSNVENQNMDTFRWCLLRVKLARIVPVKIVCTLRRSPAYL
jgi:hypothetical protein